MFDTYRFNTIRDTNGNRFKGTYIKIIITFNNNSYDVDNNRKFYMYNVNSLYSTVAPY